MFIFIPRIFLKRSVKGVWSIWRSVFRGETETRYHGFNSKIGGSFGRNTKVVNGSLLLRVSLVEFVLMVEEVVGDLQGDSWFWQKRWQVAEVAFLTAFCQSGFSIVPGSQQLLDGLCCWENYFWQDHHRGTHLEKHNLFYYYDHYRQTNSPLQPPCQSLLPARPSSGLVPQTAYY